MLLPVLLLAVIGGAFAEVTKYDGYKVYGVIPSTEEQAALLQPLTLNHEFDFWSDLRRPGYKTSIMVSPEAQESFTKLLQENNIPYELEIQDVEQSLAAERQEISRIANLHLGRLDFVSYHPYSHIQSYLQSVASNYPNITTLEVLGTSGEGREVNALRISTGGSGKPLILVDAGIHAREWIAPAQALYIIQELVENPNNTYLIENVDWYIIPVLNPDGYEFTFTNTRLWRKTRAPGSLCFGVDGNRNFDFHWLETGASTLECAETYAGPEAFSEPETAALAAFVERNNNSIKLYLTFHSYGNYLLYPWGYTSDLPDDWEVLDSLAVDVERAISAVAGTRYTIGSSTNVLYAAAGGSDDWVKGVGGVALSYTIELPGGGNFGFDLPASRIDAVVKETFEGIKVYQAYVEQNYGRK